MTATGQFCVWLQKKHPDIVLVPMQKRWFEFIFDQDHGKFFSWCGCGSGKTFVAELLEEYISDGGKI